MSQQSRRLLRGSARAITGIAIIGVSVAVALSLGSGLLPASTVEREVISIDVDTSRNAQLTLVCSGAFGELGADPSQPTVSIPVGFTELVIAGASATVSELARENVSGSDPRVIESPVTATLAAAEMQVLRTPTLDGAVATSCTEAAHEQWLVGGGAALGMSTTVVLGNPFDVPATVQLTIFDENGQLDDRKTAGVLVPARTQRIVSINGYAPGSELLAVRVESSGAAVTAHLSVSHQIEIRSFAIDSVTSQLAAAETLIVSGVTNVGTHEHGPTGELQDHEDFPVLVRVLAPGSSGGSATVSALFANGQREVLGSIEFVGGVVAELTVSHWPEEANAVLIEADTPVVGGVLGSADLPPNHDYAWFAPAPVLPAGEAVGLAIVPGGELVLVNPGDAEARVTIEHADGGRADTTVNVAAGAAVPVAVAEGGATLRVTAPIAAGVRVVEGATIAGYPVQAPPKRTSSLTVYTR